MKEINLNLTLHDITGLFFGSDMSHVVHLFESGVIQWLITVSKICSIFDYLIAVIMFVIYFSECAF